MRAVSITFALALLTTSGVPASAASTIDFSDLVPGSSFTTYADSGFTVSPTSGSWKVNSYGAPGPSIVFFGAPVQQVTTAQIQITAGGLPFTFSSVDLYSSVTPIPYQFTGLLGGSTVFTETGTEPNTFGTFKIVHVTSMGIIDTLLITLSNPAVPGFANPMGLDNVVVNIAIANPGDLDPSFGSGGKVITTFPGQVGSIGGAYAVGLQPDGKIVAAGSSFSSSPGVGAQFALARYNADGSLDTTFGSGGRVRTGFGGANARARALALQPDGKIVAAGTPGFSLARYNPDGTLDPDFGVFGTISTMNESAALALDLQPDGKLIVAGGSIIGPFFSEDFAVARYTPDAFVIGGGLDGSFGNGGVATTDFRTTDQAFAVAVQPDGKIVAAGQASADFNFGPSVVALARYNPDGSADATFGSGGKVMTAFGNGPNDRASAMALQPDGKIVIAGVTTTGAFQTAFAVARYNPDGSLDGTFGSGGKVITQFQFAPAEALAVAVQPDGAIVVGGHGYAGFGGEFALVRYTPNGSPDVSFGHAGVVTTAFGDLPHTIVTRDGFYGLALQPDGKIVAAGVFSGSFALARYHGGPSAPFKLELNQSTFMQGDVMVLTATLEPDSSLPPLVDVYVVLQLADGSFLSRLLDGCMVAGIMPAASQVPWLTTPLRAEILRYTFIGGEPPGNYRWLAALVQAGTSTVVSAISEQPFTINP